MVGATVETLDLMLPASPSSVAEARHELTAYAERCGWYDLWPVKVAVSEAVGNAVVHAYPDGSGRDHVRIRAHLDQGRLLVSIEDDGVGMRPRIDSPGLGIGISLIQRLTDRLVMKERSEGGVQVELCFARHAGQDACA
ncbi:MAG: ATP-binding protein [Geminicoccaceae bacterium]|jgi:anti-sigma regulatory factor (Ser/Thr protein kinase)|nr:ATP-binding protein [Geminicoccaceae bacterium]